MLFFFRADLWSSVTPSTNPREKSAFRPIAAGHSKIHEGATGSLERTKIMFTKNRTDSIYKIVGASLLMGGLLLIPSLIGFARDKDETIDATAFGTSTQMGQNFGITVIIYEFSTPADRQVLVEAFEKGQNQGLVNALTKMKAVGHISITGTLGYDLSFIKLIPTPTGRKIRFITNRPIHFGEAFFDTQSQYNSLTAGELDLNDTDKSKSTGTLYPAAQLVIDKEGQLQFDLNQNAWRLVDLLDWKGTPGVN
jgi:hypothetical protein